MATEVVVQFRSDLEERLSRKRSQLDATEESLKRYVAFPREEGFQRTSLKARLGPPPNRPGRREAREPRENDQTERRPFRSSIESRLGPKPNQESGEAPRRIMSTVVVDHKTRDEAIKESPLDKQDALRGKRIFGRLLGTLQQFCQDENKSQDRMLKKRKIELKIEEKTEKEKEEAILKKRELFSERKKQQRELKELEAQLFRTEQFELWEKSKIDEMKFIHTQKGANRQISFLPKEHNKLTQKALEETIARVEEEIRVQKEIFETDIVLIGKKNPDVKDEAVESGDEDSENLKPSSRISSTIRVVDDVLDNNEDSASEDERNDAFGIDSVDPVANLGESSEREEEEEEKTPDRKRREEKADSPKGRGRSAKTSSDRKSSERPARIERNNQARTRRQRSSSGESSSPERQGRKPSPVAPRKKRSPRSSNSD